MLSFLLIFLLGIPLSVLLHEIGHALGVILFTKQEAHVYLGPANDKNNENFRIGRIHFHIIWANSGFCFVKNESDFSRFSNIMYSAGGPIVSLLLAGISHLVTTSLTNFSITNFFTGVFYANLSMFIFTILPITYPNWLKPYAGRYSDGYHILKAIKAK
ncbi:hypothetical protein [Planococcus alpniumensis]|uniref:hypothetical protein n=1 Tax=Planococcus alpniumensis TaxID=2708345 RepID=UPI001B8B401F|nr:hypothetical protein [Planococcus sp. MSAK28401]